MTRATQINRPMAVSTIEHETHEQADAASAESAARRPDAWDVVGVLALAAAMLAVERLAVVTLDTTVGRSTFIRLITVACPAAVVLGTAVLLWRDRPPLSDLPRRLTAFWRDPPGAWVSFVIGAVLALPILAFYAPIVLYDADSARLVAAARYLRDGNFNYFTDTQEPYLPPALLGPVLYLRGLAGAKMITLITMQLLAGTVSYVTFRITNRMLAAASAVVSLFALSAVFERTYRLPLYPTALVLGYAGGWLCYRAMRHEDGVRWRVVVPAGVLLALAPEAQGTGQLFLAIPFLLVPFAPSIRAAVRTTAAVFLVIGVASIPRLVINLAVGGLSYITSPRADFWITEGYLTQIQRDFFHYPGIDESVPEFLGKLPGRFMDFLGTQAWVVIALAILGWLLAGRTRARVFVASALVFLVLAVTVKRIPPFPRYYAPVWPGLAILSGVAVGYLAGHRARLGRAVAIAAALALAGAATVAFRTELRRTDATYLAVEALPLRALAAEIDDGKGVIGNRAQQAFNTVSADIPTWGGQFLSEEELVTFLTWPSDDAVIEMMERHNIGWVFIDTRRELETRYNNTWLLPRYGVMARHIDGVANSPRFCRWLDFNPPGDYVLFRLGACPAS
jgi:hypothetical protein